MERERERTVRALEYHHQEANEALKMAERHRISAKEAERWLDEIDEILMDLEG